MGRWIRVLIAALCLLLLVAGCSAGSVTARLSRAERRWQRQAASDYRIEVSHGRGTSHYQTHLITVRNGEVVDVSASCVTAPMEKALDQTCAVEEFNPDDYTVPGLFALARSAAEESPKGAVRIEYDGTYGFPTTISVDLPEVVDDEQAWSVKAFELLD